MRYKIEGKLTGEELEQTVLRDDPLTGMAEQVSREVINLKEENIKEALVKLGWTPPGEKSRIEALESAIREHKKRGEKICGMLRTCPNERDARLWSVLEEEQ